MKDREVIKKLCESQSVNLDDPDESISASLGTLDIDEFGLGFHSSDVDTDASLDRSRQGAFSPFDPGALTDADIMDIARMDQDSSNDEADDMGSETFKRQVNNVSKRL